MNKLKHLIQVHTPTTLTKESTKNHSDSDNAKEQATVKTKKKKHTQKELT